MIQGLELADIKPEKESLKNELTCCKAKLLRFVDKDKQWHKDMDLVVESENTLKGKYDEMERKLQEKEKDIKDMIIAPVAQSSEQTILQDIS